VAWFDRHCPSFDFRHSPMCNCTSEDAPSWRRPGIHTPCRGYGFRARSLCSRPGMTEIEICRHGRANQRFPVQPPSQKYSHSLLTQITSISPAIPARYRGAFRDRHERKVGMRWTRAVLLTRAPPCGRRSRVVLTPRRWRQVGDDASHHADDGGKQARSPGRARRNPLKPLRAGMPGDPGATVVTNARAYYSTRAAAGATGTRHSPLPS
jgi:hypothetical protein